MDPTLTALLRELFSYSQQIDQLRARVAELERQMSYQPPPVVDGIPPGWHLVKADEFGPT